MGHFTRRLGRTKPHGSVSGSASVSIHDFMIHGVGKRERVYKEGLLVIFLHRMNGVFAPFEYGPPYKSSR